MSVDALGHNYSEIFVIEPTCAEHGYTLHRCSNCSDYYATDFTEKNEHTSSEWITDSEAGCVTSGSRHKECTECGKLLETETIPAKGHSYGEVQRVEATCESSGCTYHICATCGYTEKISGIPAKGHTEVIDEGKGATCTETGLTEGKHCSECGKVLVLQEVIEKKEHTSSE